MISRINRDLILRRRSDGKSNCSEVILAMNFDYGMCVPEMSVCMLLDEMSVGENGKNSDRNYNCIYCRI